MKEDGKSIVILSFDVGKVSREYGSQEDKRIVKEINPLEAQTNRLKWTHYSNLSGEEGFNAGKGKGSG